ncbi:Threonine synthase-like 2, partial [Armadillidium nasatum]
CDVFNIFITNVYLILIDFLFICNYHENIFNLGITHNYKSEVLERERGGRKKNNKIKSISEHTITITSDLEFVHNIESRLKTRVTPKMADFIYLKAFPKLQLKNYINGVSFHTKKICVTSFERFYNSTPIGVKSLDKNLSVFELFYGPTLAFKDLALFVVSGLLDYFTKKRNKHLTALVATSGDTGSSALESVKGRENLDLIVLLPQDRCSLIQKLQMTTFDGSSDDLDVPIKMCFEDKDFASQHNLISMNSINIGRILAQIPIYVFGYYKLASKIGEEVEIVVPTGAAGSITAGSMAHFMGFPIRLVVSVNVNDIVARTLRHGIFSQRDQVFKTLANAMDIQMPCNLERIFYIYSKSNEKIVLSIMKDFESKSRADIPQELMNSIKQVVIESEIVSDEEIIKTIKMVKEKYDYFICPHTATAAHYSLSTKESKRDIPRGIFATASPEKFPDAISDAGFQAPDERVKHLLGKKEYYLEMKKDEDWFQILKEKICSITASRSYSNDGGLYMPQSIPKVTKEEISMWRELPYEKLVYKILRKFIEQDEAPDEELENLCAASFDRFSTSLPIGIKKLEDNLTVFELFHGPTLAFKDFGLFVVAELLDYFVKKSNKHLVALVVEGTSDELDVPIKRCFEDKNFVAQHNLICLNSINIGRILAQIPIYVFAYYKLVSKIGEEVEIVVPTGAAGSITVLPVLWDSPFALWFLSP